ncbi:helix-turn-helix transcriptional regulator [Kaistia dalseonensis]|uniref:DNA-binding XRE family transcriptional regulator n=1 Tax=Kaistia dalseonensis TaxID=410840 RepID=A0ABU0HEN0_9HYPH|nr:helix-turn-helix transcriptional regulator [Kaistia dalseonensis]MCX5497664.1 helix-turn-helix transcriptional regulator [Kaistia dalseonensis]MDQ0440308.1 DNA-binding XRE family transcriptional regulator [Kaistia dalseonensis]
MSTLETAIPHPAEELAAPHMTETPETVRAAGLATLRLLREARGLSTVDLARLSGLSRDEIVALENGASFTIDQIHALAAALEVRPEQLTT